MGGGIVAFEWGGKNQSLTLLQNRDNWETREIKGAAWDTSNKILAGRCKVNNGTWLGISKNGRVAFFVDTALLFNGCSDEETAKECRAELFTIQFLKDTKSPEKFAKMLEANEKKRHKSLDDEGERGLVYDIILADITSKTMFYIAKNSTEKPNLDIKNVPFGIHTLSSDGLDNSQSLKDLRIKRLFSEMIGVNEGKEVQTTKVLASKFMYDQQKAVEKDEFSGLFVQLEKKVRYGTTSTTALVVKPSKEVMLYERFLVKGQWKEHDFKFNIH
ncbi:unnamed protein product [Cochlearia groenlandica]